MRQNCWRVVGGGSEGLKLEMKLQLLILVLFTKGNNLAMSVMEHCIMRLIFMRIIKTESS